MDISSIDPKLCTHLIYSFAGITVEGKVTVLNTWVDLSNVRYNDGYNRFNQLRKLSPGTKTLISVEGLAGGSPRYSKMASNPQTRSTFVASAVKFVKQYGFDDMGFAWLYHNQRGGVAADKENYVLLKGVERAF